MIKLKPRAEFEKSIQSSCRSLFLTSAIPDLVNSEGTMKQVESLSMFLPRRRNTEGVFRMMKPSWRSSGVNPCR